MVYEGEPTLPRGLFWSEDEVIVIRMVDTFKNNVPHKKVVMIVSDQMLWRYPDIVNEETMNYEVTDEGVFVKEYPSEYVIPSSNPENPWIIFLCNFDGSIGVEHEIKRMSKKVTTLESINTSLETENHQLREDLKEARLRLKELND